MMQYTRNNSGGGGASLWQYIGADIQNINNATGGYIGGQIDASQISIAMARANLAQLYLQNLLDGSRAQIQVSPSDVSVERIDNTAGVAAALQHENSRTRLERINSANVNQVLDLIDDFPTVGRDAIVRQINGRTATPLQFFDVLEFITADEWSVGVKFNAAGDRTIARCDETSFDFGNYSAGAGTFTPVFRVDTSGAIYSNQCDTATPAGVIIGRMPIYDPLSGAVVAYIALAAP